MTSTLTLIETDRAVLRGVDAGRFDAARAEERLAVLRSRVEHWVLFDIDGAVVERARARFPAEPIRSLDAIHLATALQIRALVPDLRVLSLDDRLRASARELGLALLPE